MEDFSLIILCKEHRHLLPLTLDTLKPQVGAFEVLILDGEEGDGRLEEFVDLYPELKIRVQSATEKSPAEMMNEGLELATGKYLQFLQPGDRYLSQHGLEFVGTLIGKEPHLVYTDPLLDSANFITARSPWFLKSKLLELGGFNGKFPLCSTTDVLCRLMQDRKTQAVFCRRVLMDSEMGKEYPLNEMCSIFYRHFGFLYTCKWLFFQAQAYLFDKAARFFKNAFWKAE